MQKVQEFFIAEAIGEFTPWKTFEISPGETSSSVQGGAKGTS